MTIKDLFAALLLSMALFAGGCASSGSTQTPAPKVDAKTYTEAEKAAMSQEEKVAAYNEAQEDDDDKIVCTRHVKTGSHFRTTRCATAAQRRKEREEAQEAIQRASRGTITNPDN